MDGVALDVVGSSRFAGVGKLWISKSAIEFVPSSSLLLRNSLVHARRWPAGTFTNLEVRKGKSFPFQIGPEFLIYSLPILWVLIPIGLATALWNGLFGTFIVIDGAAGRVTYFVKRLSVPQVTAILEEAGLGGGE